MGWERGGGGGDPAPELRSCVKIEVDVVGSLSQIYCPQGLCGRKAAFEVEEEDTAP